MWSVVEQDFAKILSTRVFHTLSDDPGYVEIFRRAGFKGKLPTDLSQAPAAAREQLKTAAMMCAQLLRDERGVQELSSRTARQGCCH
jgi:hypothetical protein